MWRTAPGVAENFGTTFGIGTGPPPRLCRLPDVVMRMYPVVAYDISDDRRRARLYELLLGYGTPVQRSVFECELTADQEADLRRKAARYVRGPHDSIRYYQLCAACARRTAAEGTSLPEQRDDDYFV